MNYCSFIGNLTADPKLRRTDTGTSVANFDIAVNPKGRRDTRGDPLYMPVQCWEKLAELVDEHLRKGRKVFVSGELLQQRYEDREGNRREKFVLNAREVEFLDAPSDNGRRDDRDDRDRGRGRDDDRGRDRDRGRDDDRYRGDPGPSEDRGGRTREDPF